MQIEEALTLIQNLRKLIFTPTGDLNCIHSPSEVHMQSEKLIAVAPYSYQDDHKGGLFIDSFHVLQYLTLNGAA